MKTIVLTCTERRAFHRNYGQPMSILWCAEGTDTDLNAALAYAVGENRRGDGADYRVHTFAPDYANWAHEARSIHRYAARYAV